MKNTINDLLSLLKSNRCGIDVKHIAYKPISRKVIAKPAELTDAEKQQVAEAVITATTTTEMQEALKAGDKLITEKQAIKFQWAAERFAIASITGNETRGNVSILVKIHGTCELPESRPQTLPKVFGTFVWRNYAVVKDGELNIEKLPVVLNRAAYDELVAAGKLQAPWLEGNIYEIDLGQFTMTAWTDPLDASEYVQNHLDLTYAKGTKKVIKHFAEMLEPKDATKTLKEMFGEEAAAWLESVGITDGGYGPKGEAKEPTSYYEATELQVKTKGLSIPSVNALLKKLEAGKKLNAGDQWLNAEMSRVQAALDKLGTTEEKLTWLEEAKRENTKEINRISDILEAKKMAVIADNAWFAGYTRGEAAVINHPSGLVAEATVATTQVWL